MLPTWVRIPPSPSNRPDDGGAAGAASAAYVDAALPSARGGCDRIRAGKARSGGSAAGRRVLQGGARRPAGAVRPQRLGQDHAAPDARGGDAPRRPRAGAWERAPRRPPPPTTPPPT